MNLAIIIASIGLFLDILGISLLFKYPPNVPKHDGTPDIVRVTINETEVDKNEREANKKIYSFRSKIGFILLIIGFSLQIFALWIPVIL